MESIKKNFILNSTSSLLAVIVPIITTPYISRILGPTFLGEYSYNYTVATYFTTFALLGLNNYGNRMIASIRENADELSKQFWSIYGMQLIIGSTVTVIYLIYGFTVSRNLAFVFIPYVISSTFNINWFFYGMELFKLTVPRNILIKIITTVCVFVFVRESSDLWKYSLIISLGALISEIALWPYLRNKVKFYCPSIKEMMGHLKPNIILFIPVLAVSLYKLMDKVMLGVMSSSDEVGYYEASEKLIQIPNTLVVSLGTIMLPRMSNLFANKDKSKINYYIERSFIVSMLISVPMSLGIMAIANELVPIFFGKGYEKCILLIQFILPSCIFVAFANVIRTQYLIPNKMDKIYIKSVWLGAIVNLFFNLLFIPKYASVGAAIGTLLAEASVCLYQVVVIRKNIKLFSILKDVFFIVFSGIVMYFVVYNIKIFENNSVYCMIVKVLIGIAIFCGFLGIHYLIVHFKKNKKKLSKC